MYNSFLYLDEKIHPTLPSIKGEATGGVYLVRTGICSNMKQGTAIESLGGGYEKSLWHIVVGDRFLLYHQKYERAKYMSPFPSINILLKWNSEEDSIL